MNSVENVLQEIFDSYKKISELTHYLSIKYNYLKNVDWESSKFVHHNFKDVISKFFYEEETTSYIATMDYIYFKLPKDSFYLRFDLIIASLI